MPWTIFTVTCYLDVSRCEKPCHTNALFDLTINYLNYLAHSDYAELAENVYR